MKATWMLLVVAVVWICFPNTSGATQIVTFGDSRVEWSVRWYLSIPEPTPITADDMLLLTMLPAHAENGDFTGLEYAKNLVRLACSTGAYPPNLWPLADLTNLHSFHMDNSQLTDISALGGLTNLSELYLRGNDISDITPLGGLTSLRGLYLQDNDISDITPLGGLENLSYLELSDNRITDISPLSNLENPPSGIVLNGNQISDLSPLSGMTLSDLYLRDNEITDISALADTTIQLYLDLRGNPLNEQAYTIYIPLIEANNPRVRVYYDPIPEPMALVLTVLGGVGLLGRRRR